MTMKRTGRMLSALLALAEPYAGGAAVAAAVAGGAVLLSSSQAQAQNAWGVSRRTARRTTRRTSARQDAIYTGGVATPYLGVLPVGYRTVVVGGATYYESEGVRYEARIVEGQTVYVQVP